MSGELCTDTMLCEGEAEAGFVSLATLDESEPWETDCYGIILRPDGKLLLRCASGCSCWDGDFDEAEFDTLADLAAAMVTQEYNAPSIKGGEAMVAKAIKNLVALRGGMQ